MTGKTFSDYGIQLPAGAVGRVYTTCPFCSAQRKKKNAKCLAVDIDKGVWICNHCGCSGGLGKRNEYPRDLHWNKPKYIRPAPRPTSSLPQSVLDWFHSRGITNDVVERNKIGYGIEYMPQVENNVATIIFPYFRNGELINRKYRGLVDKHFRLETRAELVLYGLDDIDSECVVIVEGECFPGDSEVLTRNGWCKFSDYKGQEILQHSNDGSSEFVRPLAIVKKHFAGDLVRHEKKGWLSLTTPEHNIVTIDIKNRLRKCSAREYPQSTSDRVVRSTKLNGKGIDLTNDQIALCLAVSADASIRSREHGYSAPYVAFGFKKQRKIDRLRSLIDRLKLSVSDAPTANGYTSICFHIPEWVCGRFLPWSWISDATLEQREFILKELVEWDGNRVNGRNQDEFTSKYKHNADFVQALAHTTGRCSSIIARRNKLGEWYKVSILHGKRFTSSQHTKTSFASWNDDVFCVSVPSEMILVRQENNISVSGNCDKLALEMAGFLSVVSVPNGAPPATTKEIATHLRYLEADWEKLESVKRFILAVDSDEPGKRLEEELTRRLGIEKCSRVEWPEGCKDANDVLLHHGVDDLRWYIENAEPFPIEGVIAAFDKQEAISRLYASGFAIGVSTGWPLLDDLYKIRPGQLTVVSGIPGSGKSNFVDSLIVNMARMHDWRFAIFSPENLPIEQHMSAIAEKYVGKPFNDGPMPRMSPVELGDALEWMHNHFSWILPHDEAHWEVANILKIAGQLCLRYGIRGLVIDPWNELEALRPANMSETEYVSQCLKRIRVFARQRDIHVWLVAHPAKLYRNKEDGKYPVPTLYDVSGSANWRNKADNGIIVWRDLSDHDMAEVQIHIQKIRFRQDGKRGMVKLYYEPICATYSEQKTAHYTDDYFS